MSMKFKSGMLKIHPWLGFYNGNTPGVPLPLPAVFSRAFQAWYYALSILPRGLGQRPWLWTSCQASMSHEREAPKSEEASFASATEFT